VKRPGLEITHLQLVMEKIVDPVQRIENPMLFSQNPLKVYPPQTAHPIFHARSRSNPVRQAMQLVCR
jgi:hypothetical protein